MRNKNTGDWNQFAEPLGWIRLILLVDWDPIGVFGYPGAMDEYDSYAPGVHDLLVSNASQDELAAYLRQIEVEQMGVRGNPNRDSSAVAAKLQQVYNRLACEAARAAQS